MIRIHDKATIRLYQSSEYEMISREANSLYKARPNRHNVTGKALLGPSFEAQSL